VKVIKVAKKPTVIVELPKKQSIIDLEKSVVKAALADDIAPK
jgi:hypothetical protein